MIDINRFRLPGVERRFSRGPRNQAFLVTLQTRDKSRGYLQESFLEMKELAEAARVRIVGFSQSHLPHPSPSHFIRQGKLSEIKEAAKQLGANLLIFNIDLAPAQIANIENFTGFPAIDRTGLILDIFARRAKSKEGKLQVELAQLNYTLPRLGGLGTVMSRMGGGIGGRGPGEQELEKDRRKVRRRIQQVKEELGRVRRHRLLLRSGRKRKNFITTALVGYTNAGKSTLLNALTGSDAYVEDKVFATLDPVTRLEKINGRTDMLFVDTVGFIRDLPHALVESFHATLEEVSEADILIHVLDVSSAHTKELKEAVEKVLQGIKAINKPTLLALNKADLLSAQEQQELQAQWQDGILISAKEGLGLKSLLVKLDSLADSIKAS